VIVEPLLRNWWALAGRATAAFAFMMVALAWPAARPAELQALFAAYVAAAGAATLVAATFQRGRRRRVWMLAWSGAIGCVAGAALIAAHVDARTFAYAVALNAVLTGALELSAAEQLRRRLRDDFSLGAGAAVALLGGAVIAALTWLGAEDVRLLLVVYTFAAGATAARATVRAHDAEDTLRGPRPKVV
jgi:uncharacterized membrane protein HdeD (DUF308 family)